MKVSNRSIVRILLVSQVAQCDMPLPDPKNGIVTCSQAKEYESVCKFYCDQGYTLSMGGEADEDKLYEQVRNRLLVQ